MSAIPANAEEKHIYVPPRLKKLGFDRRPKRYKILIGGRGSAKSQTVADLCLRDSHMLGIKIACFREYMNSLKESVHSLLKDEIERLGLRGYNVKESEIVNNNNGLFTFAGLARNIMSIQSMHGYKRFWIEEAQTMSEESIRVVPPTLRTPGSEIWMTANPQSRADPFSQHYIVPYEKELFTKGFYEDELMLIVLINYMDNPMFPDVLEQERLHDKEIMSAALYAHVWLGRYNDEVEGAIIPAEWFDAAIDAHEKLGFKPIGQKIVAHDPSDLGSDDKGLACRHGSIITDVRLMDTGDINAGADWALDYAADVQADVFRWDTDGMGLGLKKQVGDYLEGKRCAIEQFSGGGGVDFPEQLAAPDDRTTRTTAKTNRQTFKNKRAQAYWATRERFRHTYLAIEKGQYIDPELLISLSGKIDCLDKLRSELCRIPQKHNPNGLIQIMSKDEMKRMKPPLPSPNLADSVMMTMPIPRTNLAAQTRELLRNQGKGMVSRRSNNWRTQ